MLQPHQADRELRGSGDDRDLCRAARLRIACAGAAVEGGEKMRASKLIGRLTIYYLVIAGVVLAAMYLWPGIRGYLPIGGVEQLISQPSHNPLKASEAVR